MGIKVDGHNGHYDCQIKRVDGKEKGGHYDVDMNERGGFKSEHYDVQKKRADG